VLTRPVLWIEGIIGAGKTTLAKQLGDALHMRVIEEPVESNPYLPLFYKEPKTWAWTMQMHLMGVRYGMQKLAVSEALVGHAYNGAILDRGLPGDRVFCRLHVRAGNIHEMQWHTYETFYNIMVCDLRPPSLILYLDVDPNVALERVQKRARSVETGLSLEYLQDLRRGYMDLLSEIESGDHAWSKGMRVMRVPWNVDHQSIAPIVERLRRELHVPTSRPEVRI
jgi:deoxyadenosine/deoxycytidine kinase